MTPVLNVPDSNYSHNCVIEYFLLCSRKIMRECLFKSICGEQQYDSHFFCCIE